MRAAVRVGLLVAVIAGALASVGQSVPGAEAAGPGTWTYAANLPAGYATTSATLLRDGTALHAGGFSSSYSTLSPTGFRYYPSSNTWTATGPHVTPRGNATVTLLRDGRVLMAGGLAGYASEFPPALASTELYNPSTNTWSAGPLLPRTQADHEAVLLLDGRVLLIGGQVSLTSCLADVHIFNPATNTVTAAASLSRKRSSMGAVLLQDGRVLVAGGVGNCLDIGPVGVGNTAEIYDPATDTWAPATSMISPRLSYEMMLLPDGRVLAVGGRTFGFTPYDAVGSEIYDPATNTWTATGPMNTDRYAHDALLLGDGKVLAAGGSTDGAGYVQIASSEVYDPATDTWSPGDALNQARGTFVMTMLTDGRVLAVGGNVSYATLYATAELWNPTSWRAVAPMSSARASHSMSLLQDGRVLAAGGRDGSGRLDTAEVYDPKTDTWSMTGSMINARERHAAITLADGRVFVIGGDQSGIGGEIWSPMTGTWTPTTPSPQQHGGHSATLLRNGLVFVFGQGNGGDLYNPASNSWTTSAPAPDIDVNYHRATLLADGRVMITGGLGGGTGEPWIYDPMTDEWSVLSGAPGGWLASAVSMLANGNVLIAGGTELLPVPNPAIFHDEAYVVNPLLGTWSSVAALPSGGGGNATLLYDGDIVVQQFADAVRYDVASNIWTSAGDLVTQRSEEGPSGLAASSASMRLASGNVLLTGGRDGALDITAASEIYDLGIHTDTDGDGYNDGLELALSQHPWAACPTMRADVNMDGVVNSGDQLKLAQNFFLKPPQARVDQDGNLKINSGDQLRMALQYGKSVLTCP